MNNEFVEQKIRDVLAELNYEYQDIQIDRVSENFNISVFGQDGKKILSCAIPIEYFEDEDRKNELTRKIERKLKEYR
ncbi:MAG: hypothetical protein KKB21_05520 [Nanoarchaeota archaeon]|nr:hypothetical protein [Nanoarchaeota archaeon]